MTEAPKKKGYVILTEEIKDPAGMAEYGKLAMQAMAGANILAVDQKPRVIEGEWHGSQTVVLDFMPRFELDFDGLQRVTMQNVAGYHHVPVKVLK